MINWFIFYLAAQAVMFVIEFWLKTRQLRAYNSQLIPEKLQSIVTKEEFSKAQEYSRTKVQFAMLKSWITTAFELSFWGLRLPQAIYGMIYTKYYDSYCTDGYTSSYFDDWALGICFIIACSIIESVVETPFGLFSQFMIEETHGFNK